MQTEHSVWSHRPAGKDDSGAQIDLLIDRKNCVINLCEMKFGDAEFVIDKKYAGELRTKQDAFRRATGTRKTLFLTLVAQPSPGPGRGYGGRPVRELVKPS